MREGVVLLLYAGALHLPTMPPAFRVTPRFREPVTRAPSKQLNQQYRWAQASVRYKQAHPLCVGCQAVGRVAAATVTDHIIPHKGDEALFWDEDNWQAACAPHHDIVKQRMEKLYAAGKCSAADLYLGSALAVRLTRELL